ncbi:hypothetical protein JCM16303_003827 [Sporobolomyces ruberrimus]
MSESMRSMPHSTGNIQEDLQSSGAAEDTSIPRSLPSLLSHLSLSVPSFSPCVPSTSTFTFPPPSSSSSPHPSSPRGKRDPSSSDRHSSLFSFSRLKKRKLLHTHFRSPILFSPPSSPSSSSYSNPSSSRTTLRTTTTVGRGIPSKWWASVSRCDGESKQSRFGPKEEEWTGQNHQYEQERQNRSMQVIRSEGGQGSLDMGLGRGGKEVVVLETRIVLLERPSTLSRSISAPAILDSTSTTRQEDERGRGTEGLNLVEQVVVPVSGPALKKLLLASLRQKWTSEGGPTSAGEASLRFKKWVMWNAWRIETQGYDTNFFGEYDGENEEGESSSSDEEEDSNMVELLSTEHDSSEEEEEHPTSRGRERTEQVTTLTIVPSEYFTDLTPGSESSYGGGCAFTLTGQMVDLDLPTPPNASHSHSNNSPTASPPKSPPASSTRTHRFNYLTTSIPDTQPSTSLTSSRPGLKRSSTVPTTLPSSSTTPRSTTTPIPPPPPSTSNSSQIIPSPLVPIVSHVLCGG